MSLPAVKNAIPARLNLVLLAGAALGNIGLLYLASHPANGWVLAGAVVAFSFLNNTIFFPTALTFQRIFHLRHHRNNRTEVEQFDYLRPEDNKFLKRAQWYAILTGLYWLASPLGIILYLFWPGAFQLRFLRDQDSRIAQQTGANAMFAGFDDAPVGKIRLEILFTIALQVSVVLLAGVTWWGWLLCYAAFAVNWSSLQYADHAWSELDVREGAWNLHVNPVVRWIFLNYHHHKAHHQHPEVPWSQLEKYVDPAEPRPSFLRVYFSMWRGPRPLPKSD